MRTTSHHKRTDLKNKTIKTSFLIAVLLALGNNWTQFCQFSQGTSMIKKIQLGALCATLVIATGCATISTDDLAAVRAIAESAQSTANDAERQAGEARQMASGAQSTANQALSAANAAQACCDATNERVDRMFEASQTK
jgi:murein lipoprotein